jgi:membrane-bound metal-dependent hydrolase YbcI (DUF457 family)
MAFAFGHLVGAWILGKIFEFSGKKKISRLGWFFLLAGGILPDIDLIIDWVLKLETHRTFTHNILFAIVAPLCLYGILYLYKFKEKRTYTFLFLAGIISHLIIDMFSFPGIPLFWPHTTNFAFSGLIYVSQAEISMFDPDIIKLIVKRFIIDMGIGTLWLFYLWFRKRIQF